VCVLAGCAVFHVEPVRAADAPPASDATEIAAGLDAGDEAWWAGDRRTARQRFADAWRDAAAARAGGDPRDALAALEARARLRAMVLGTNLSPLRHQGALFRALDSCPPDSVACRLAEAELALLLPAGFGGDPAAVTGILEGLDDGPARARRVAAGADPALLRTPTGEPRPDLDGMGRAMLATRKRLPDNPGTRQLAVGLGGAPGAGIAATVRWVDPDAAGRAWTWDSQVGADTRGGGTLASSLAGRVAGGSVLVTRTVLDDWRTDVPVRRPLEALRMAAWGVPWVRPGTVPVALELGVDARTERVDGEDWVRALGPGGAVVLGADGARGGHAMRRGPWQVRLHGEAALGDLPHARAGADARVRLRAGATTVAFRAAGDAVLLDTSPWWRWPALGGASVLRGQPAGRWRDRHVLVAQAELRRPLAGPLGIALFQDVGRVSDGWHATAGAGLRVYVPGMEAATTRLDAGWVLDGPDRGTWGLVAGVGEAF
jgi:hypothetical protein